MLRVQYRACLSILLLLSFTIFIGCSVDSNPIATTDSDINSSTLQTGSNDSSEPYPPISKADLENLIPGHTVLSLDSRAIEAQGTLDDFSSQYIRRIRGGTVTHNNNGIQIGPWQLQANETVTVSTPCPGYPIVDFYPHPYQFNGHVRIWFDLTNVELPPGRGWWEIEMYYVNDNGEYERYWGYVDERAHQFIGWTDHFSRYILTIPTSRFN